MLKDAMAFYSAIEGKIKETVKAMSGRNLQCERYDVTTAPNSTTGKIGVTQPFGTEIFMPYSAACAGALPGDSVIVVWWKSLSNAKAWFMGDAIGEGAFTLSDALNAAYPVGSLYLSVSGTSPATLFGGTWERIQDVFLLAAGSTYAAGSTGGEAAHTLTTDEIPSHSHGMRLRFASGSDASTYAFSTLGNSASGDAYAGNTGDAGNGEAHNNLPPYLAVYVWKRTA